MTTQRARNGPIMAALVALIMCAVCIGFIASLTIEVMANNTDTMNPTATQQVAVNTEAPFTIKEAHCDAIFGTSAANIAINTPTTVTTAPSTMAVTISGLKSQTPATGNIASPPATVVNVYMMARNGIRISASNANLLNHNPTPAMTKENYFGAWLATSRSSG